MTVESPAAHTVGRAMITATHLDALMLVNLPDIHTYEHNPRRCPNQEYDRIRASIRSQGLDQPLVITQRPGEPFYIPCAGGNTRLKILQELFDETGDQRFFSVQCLYKPFTTESLVLLAHLRENELRGNLSFIDKAHAVLVAKRVLAAELADSEISQRRLAKLITNRGLSISYSMISKMTYAVDRLFPLIPQALAAGMGKPQVEKLNNLERMGRQLWQHYAIGSDDEFDETFGALCRRYDSPDWDSDNLVTALEHEIAEAAETSLHAIRCQLAALIDGRNPLDQIHGLADWQEEIDSSKSADGSNAPTHGVEAEDTAKPLAVNQARAIWSSEDGPAATPPTADARLSSLRDKAYRLASVLAERNGFAGAVTPLPDRGLGFLISDIPDPVLADTLDPALLGQIACLWWQLVACSELTVGPRQAVLAYLDAGSPLHTLVSGQGSDSQLFPVQITDPGQWAAQLWRQLGDPDWRDLLQLMDTYRAIHKHATKLGLPLWE